MCAHLNKTQAATLLQAEPTDVRITQISGALTNLIYRCQHVPSGEVGVQCPSLRLTKEEKQPAGAEGT